MSVVDKIQEKIDRDLYIGSSDAAYEEMWDDIESLLILFRAKNRAIEEQIDRLKDYANSSDDYDRAEFAINILKKLL